MALLLGRSCKNCGRMFWGNELAEMEECSASDRGEFCSRECHWSGHLAATVPLRARVGRRKVVRKQDEASAGATDKDRSTCGEDVHALFQYHVEVVGGFASYMETLSKEVPST
mmetsp:Transcript_1661/g.3105  ORF Transcript_1661/g.3105 Transcript_1661/m.3105 type:complete len:113 (-) Transcript_1661:659-997(-)|eukprot:CAMPEP_0184680728 /NCGR_PEP_ID=MMETSP0312-20130426/3629_1 /TAXON_ID=31354 /ORGANISM="Compsopogon coeruleus, Strain SAG 36.94" /LENGTH=112 /DNA_ID=CAMNT_0027131041 /DNA_START=75 /DNA_END=413 /DNA_ORIENTATION=-